MLRTLVTRFRYISLRVVFNTVYPTTNLFSLLLLFLITGIRGGNKDSSYRNYYSSFLAYSRHPTWIGYIGTMDLIRLGNRLFEQEFKTISVISFCIVAKTGRADPWLNPCRIP